MELDKKFWEFWLISCDYDEFTEMIQSLEFNMESDILLDSLLSSFEEKEYYEKCIIIKKEIDFRKGILDGFYDIKKCSDSINDDISDDDSDDDKYDF